MDHQELARKLKRIAILIDAYRNDIPEVYASLMDAYITVDPANTSEYPSRNQNRVSYPGCETGILEADVLQMIDLFDRKNLPHFYIVLSPNPQVENIRSWLSRNDCHSFEGTGYPTLFRPAKILTTHKTKLQIQRLTKSTYLDFERDLKEIYPARADQFLFQTSLGKPGFGHFIACDDGRAVAAGMVCMNHGLGYLYSGATLESHRNLGAQNALIVARNNFVVEQGCDWVSSETLYMLEQSLMNLKRQGFEVAYDKEIYVRKL